MSDLLTKPRPGTFAESLSKHAPQVRPAQGPLPVGAEGAAATEQDPPPSAKANDDEQVIVLGGQHSRKYSAQQRTVSTSSLACVWVYDSASRLAYKLDYADIDVVVWDYQTPTALIIEHRKRWIGIEGARLQTLVEQLDARRIGELSAAARPELDPKTESKAHIRRVIVRLQGHMRIANGQLDVLPDYEEEATQSAAKR